MLSALVLRVSYLFIYLFIYLFYLFFLRITKGCSSPLDKLTAHVTAGKEEGESE
eukprot:gene4701-3394_t